VCWGEYILYGYGSEPLPPPFLVSLRVERCFALAGNNAGDKAGNNRTFASSVILGLS